MNEFDVIMTQLNKTPFQPRTEKWVTLTEIKSGGDLSDADVIQDQPHSHASASKLRFSTITDQIQKKKPSKKSKKDRIAEKSVLLADRLKSHSYK
jgi:hypothetical protein